jgi:hypothetical protein
VLVQVELVDWEDHPVQIPGLMLCQMRHQRWFLKAHWPKVVVVVIQTLEDRLLAGPQPAVLVI